MKLDLDEFCEQQGSPDFQIHTQGPRGTWDVRGPRREHASPLWRAVIHLDAPRVDNSLPWQYPSELLVNVLLLCRSPKV